MKAKDNCRRVLKQLAAQDGEYADFPVEYETQTNKLYKCIHNKVMYINQKQIPAKPLTSSQQLTSALKP